ncbi:hypothetical protein ACFQO7_31995 [Catellatospora aurea]|uniref:Uncharacterized protein n=1 Tax=Catellatospora aurea TaxID=1337874 RepID=A0ABW2H5C8_9ACTN
MVPDWLADHALPPEGTVEELLAAAQSLIPLDLLSESGLGEELTECARFAYLHLWMNGLQDVGWFAQETGRDMELPREFWLRLAAAAFGMGLPEFVPYCLGKAQGRPRRDIPDLIAALATMPLALGPAWPREAGELRLQCDRAANLLRMTDSQLHSLLMVGEVQPLSVQLTATGFPESIDEVLSESFDDLFALVTSPAFPERCAEHAWAVIATNRFRVALSSGSFPGTCAVVWWRAG